MSNSNKQISLLRPFAEGDPKEWYDICCMTNEREDTVKAKKLPTLLEGEVLAIWLELTTEEKATYGTSKSKIIELVDDFCAQKLGPDESISTS